MARRHGGGARDGKQGPVRAVQRVVLIGAGPRGLAVLERICANARGKGRAYEVFLVDPAEPGAGAVWRRDQSGVLLMNTVASQVSVFPDDSVSMEGPVEPGPSLYEWVSTAALHELGRREEAAQIGPDDYPSRRLYGDYLEFAFRSVRDRAPSNVRIETVTDVVDRLQPVDALGLRHHVILSSGGTIRAADYIVMSLGHSEVEPSASDRRNAACARTGGGVFLHPMNPADADLDGIPAGEDVIVRGLGLNFFDHMALLTLGRGGRFVRDGDDGPLRYRASGAEPVLHVGSRRGIPHHSRGRNEKGATGRAPARLLNAARIEALRRKHLHSPLRFRSDVWPLIARDVECTYYEMFLTEEPARKDFTRRYLHGEESALAGIRHAFALDGVPTWDWELLAKPWRGIVFRSAADYRSWAREYLAADVEQARLGNVSGPLKSALDLLRDLRNEIRAVIDHGGIEGRSYREEVDQWYTPLNAFLSIGPPERRIEELVALMDADVVSLLGPGMTVDPRGDRFEASSAAFPEDSVSARHLIEARLPAVNAHASRNPLITSMLSDGLVSLHFHRAEDGMMESGAVAVAPRPYNVLNQRHPSGHPRLFLYGVPTEAVHWVTAAGARPGVDSITFRDADAIARAVLAEAQTGESDEDDQEARMMSIPPSSHSDSGLLSPVRAGTVVEGLLSDEAWISAMVRAEAALARAQGKLGLIPAGAAEAITRASEHHAIEARTIALASRKTANPVVAVIGELRDAVQAVDPSAAVYVHRGSTSQDIFDTALMMVAQAALREIDASLRLVSCRLGAMASAHGRTLQAARTLGGHAVPTTFGLKAATWKRYVDDAQERVTSLLSGGGLPVSVGGAGGTAAGYIEAARLVGGGEELDARQVLARIATAFAAETGLAAPPMPWHAAPTPMADVASACAIVTAAVGKIAVDVLTLSRTEIGELAESADGDTGVSSAMPQKRNPVLATMIRSASLQVPALTSGIYACLMPMDERDGGAWHAQWMLLRECLRLTGGAAATAEELVATLRINVQAMLHNVKATGPLLVSERIVIVLSARLGSERSRSVVADAISTAARSNEDILTVLSRDAHVRAAFSRDELMAMADPCDYLGIAGTDWPADDRSASVPVGSE
ncbi:FAD/NAD(P)-binding protein [Rathayibacter rathayi]|uniref:Adenylosuccinate lyase C-terminal domain-containing protein n=1 Tax=Rathayibacter rathayi TaxID=33887 RepID=A0ABD6W797_RATRA|nr:FAD/NAD(P)-binding protein [Rathayibacter rathayi]PPF13018.1 hypothetical protein C5C04_09915 [Rathayibacter rathayi]